MSLNYLRRLFGKKKQQKKLLLKLIEYSAKSVPKICT